MPNPALNNIAIQFTYEQVGLASGPPNLMSLYLVKIKNIENMTNPLAKIIIIQPKYLDKKVCKSRKNDSEISEFIETSAVIDDIKKTDIRNLGLLMLFMSSI